MVSLHLKALTNTYLLNSSTSLLQICSEDIVSGHLGEGWRACLDWAMHNKCSEGYDERQKLLSFAAVNADAERIGEIERRKEEIRVAREDYIRHVFFVILFCYFKCDTGTSGLIIIFRN